MIWPFKPKTAKVRVITRASDKLRLDEFRSDKRLVGGAQAIATNEYYKLMLQVCETEHPAFFMFGMECTLESRALHQARIEGYNLALNNLRSMTTLRDAPVEIEATFDDPDKEY